MIRINLVPQRRPKHDDQGKQTALVGLLVIIAGLAMIYLLVHREVIDDIDTLRAEVSGLERENAAKEKTLKPHKDLKKTVEDAKQKHEVVQRLSDARALPAHLMWELANLTRTGGRPTMTKKDLGEMTNNKSRQVNAEWDATHVWITGFKEKNGQFTLTGGAQSDRDMTQLALRMQASIYFHDVVPAGGQVATDKETGTTYYKFTISGKVAY